MVQCGAVSDPSDWQWSSYNAHSYGKSDPILDDHALYLALGTTPQARQEAYQQMAADSMAEKGYKEPLFSVGVILGSESFVRYLLEQYGKLTRFYHNRKIYAFQEGSDYSLHHTARPLKNTS
jgi:putative transposase